MGVMGKDDRGVERSSQRLAGVGTHLGGLCSGVGTEEAPEGNAGVSCGQGGGVSAGMQAEEGGQAQTHPGVARPDCWAPASVLALGACEGRCG